MKISFHYSSQDDVLTIYSDVAPSETIEFADFMNIDINKEKGIVGLEIFYASEFFGNQNKELTKHFLSNLKEINAKYDEWRNTWFISLELKDKDNKTIIQKLPPLKKSEYVSPLIASAY
ncbi:MAG: DUF2283 domain-containing protein [Nanoarchaeota archaeon]|nr:DUF2283 domain-containing protein [Nanoarchaeota archaeon]